MEGWNWKGKIKLTKGPKRIKKNKKEWGTTLK